MDAFHRSGIDEIVFIGGYRIESVQREYPEFTFRHNRDWQTNNILESLFCARDLMEEPFVCCYSDTLLGPRVVAEVASSPADIALRVDTGWLVRYRERTEHPSDDAEKVTVHNGRATCIDRQIAESDAYGEYIGLAKFSASGSRELCERYRARKTEFAGRPYREARTFEKAYLIHLFQDLLETGCQMAHIDTAGGYIEVDTQQDFEYARRYWTDRHLNA